MSADFRHTVFLPSTPFPMKGSLPEKEPQILETWHQANVYQKQRQKRLGAEKFILHDGPPYANGHTHIGHALNKILKDVVNRSQFMAGRDVIFTPGWDCHGLPIEWKVEEDFRKQGKKKREVPPEIFREACRAFANHWVHVQSAEFQRIGLMGDWSTPYTTMDFRSEAIIVQQFLALFMDGYVTQGVKPVLWSVVEETALAEAEVDYQEVTSPSIYVRFSVASSPVDGLENSAVVIWTTTPWTLPGNRAVAFGEDLPYILVLVEAVAEGSLACVGEKILIAKDLQHSCFQDMGIIHGKILKNFLGKDLSGTWCSHPLHAYGYDFSVPLLPGDHVTADTGTGFVHTAPGHGLEDFAIGKEFNLEIPETIGADGIFRPDLPVVGGEHVYKVNPRVIHALQEARTLLAEKSLVHSYPHSWRSKKPLIYRTTAQWFVVMDGPQNLRKKALEAIEKVNWRPGTGRTRIQHMVADRPDWCLSRQRAWGVPLTLFIDKKTGIPLRDESVNARIIETIQADGAQSWFQLPAQHFLGAGYDPENFTQVTDILDVWFDSGVSHEFVLRQGKEPGCWPASLYLEGSDQHRGWFQSSLLTGCARSGRAPYQAVVTHGFVLDEKGRKMSKSLGNVVSPEQVISQMGADVLRLWAVSSDSQEDIRVGPQILKRQEDVYRRFRNTLRYLLGIRIQPIAHFSNISLETLPELEQWVLHRLWELNQKISHGVKNFDFRDVIYELHHFCAVDLSAFYFDIRKDTIYCDALENAQRQATTQVMAVLFSCLCRWLAPVLCFTADEAWTTLNGQSSCVHLEDFPVIPHHWGSPSLAETYARLRSFRKVLTGALEGARAEKKIGSSLDAHIFVDGPVPVRSLLKGLSWADFTLTSAVTFSLPPDHQGAGAEGYKGEEFPENRVYIQPAVGEKCDRCWKVSQEVDLAEQPLCARCSKVLHQCL